MVVGIQLKGVFWVALDERLTPIVCVIIILKPYFGVYFNLVAHIARLITYNIVIFALFCVDVDITVEDYALIEGVIGVIEHGGIGCVCIDVRFGESSLTIA